MLRIRAVVAACFPSVTMGHFIIWAAAGKGPAVVERPDDGDIVALDEVEEQGEINIKAV